MTPEPFLFVIFGGTGDLAKRKLIPALRQLAALGFMPERYAIVGVARNPMTDDEYRNLVNAGPLAPHVYYQAGDSNDPHSFLKLQNRLTALETELELPGNRLYYLAVAPDLFLPILQNLKKAGILHTG